MTENATGTIEFKTREAESSKQVNYVFPTTIAALTEKWGEDAVYAAAKANLTIGLQSVLRRHFEKSQEELQAIADSWNPNERAPAVKQTAFERAQSSLSKLSPEEIRELANKLKALQKAQAA